MLDAASSAMAARDSFVIMFHHGGTPPEVGCFGRSKPLWPWLWLKAAAPSGTLMLAKRGRHSLPRLICEHADRCRDDVDGGMLVIFHAGQRASLAITM